MPRRKKGNEVKECRFGVRLTPRPKELKKARLTSRDGHNPKPKKGLIPPQLKESQQQNLTKQLQSFAQSDLSSQAKSQTVGFTGKDGCSF